MNILRLCKMAKSLALRRIWYLYGRTSYVELNSISNKISIDILNILRTVHLYEHFGCGSAASLHSRTSPNILYISIEIDWRLFVIFRMASLLILGWYRRRNIADCSKDEIWNACAYREVYYYDIDINGKWIASNVVNEIYRSEWLEEIWWLDQWSYWIRFAAGVKWLFSSFFCFRYSTQ